MTKRALVTGITGQDGSHLAELLLDAQELVVLGHPVRARRRAGLDLPGVRGDREVGDEGVFGLARAVRDDRRVARRARQLDGCPD